MGFFKDVRTLNRQGREMQRSTDVGATMADAMAQMQAGTAMLQQQTAATMMAVHGVDATATIGAIRPTGMQVNLAPVLDIDLVVIHHGIPTPTTVRRAVDQAALGRARIGEHVKVKVDPNHPQSVWIDWYTPA